MAQSKTVRFNTHETLILQQSLIRERERVNNNLTTLSGMAESDATYGDAVMLVREHVNAIDALIEKVKGLQIPRVA